MTKKETATKTGGKKLVKDCGKMIILSTMVVFVLGLGILTWKKKDRLIPGKKSSKTKSSKNENENENENEKLSNAKSWSLRTEIKKLETRQQNNMSQVRSSKGDPLLD